MRGTVNEVTRVSKVAAELLTIAIAIGPAVSLVCDASCVRAARDQRVAQSSGEGACHEAAPSHHDGIAFRARHTCVRDHAVIPAIAGSMSAASAVSDGVLGVTLHGFAIEFAPAALDARSHAPPHIFPSVTPSLASVLRI